MIVVRLEFASPARTLLLNRQNIFEMQLKFHDHVAALNRDVEQHVAVARAQGLRGMKKRVQVTKIHTMELTKLHTIGLTSYVQSACYLSHAILGADDLHLAARLLKCHHGFIEVH